jgi:hypothetical protein
MSKRLSDAELSRVCTLYIQGHSIRTLAPVTQTSRSSLHRLICARLGKGAIREQLPPQAHPQDRGIMPILNEHIAQLSPAQRRQVRAWMAANARRIADSDRRHAGTPLLTSRSERARAKTETLTTVDFRGVAESAWRQRHDY